MNIAEDIKVILDFYKALGFERLPLNYSFKFQVSSSKLRDKSKGSRIQGVKDSSKTTRSLDPSTPRPLEPSVKKAALDALREELGDCGRCKLSQGRKNIVFGEGSPEAALMFIGEAPGREEDLQARPFVGEAGQLLTRLIEKMGFGREDVYIGNIVKCRPPQNRDPEEDEIRTCLRFIEKQVEIISPRVIVSLGRISAHTLMGTKIPISKLRGNFGEYKGISLMPTFHPAYLLRSPKDKWLVWEDAQKIMERLRGL